MIRLTDLLKELTLPKIVIGRGNTKKFKVNDIFPNPVIDALDEDYNKLMDMWEDSGLRISDLPIQTININKIYPHQDTVSADKIVDILQRGAENNDMDDIFLATLDNKKYFLVDGHTRASAQILDKKTSIKGRVYSPQ